MGQLSRELLPLAVGVAISPVPIIAVLVMVLSNHARASSVGLALGWATGIALTCALFVRLSSAIDLAEDSRWSTAESIGLILLGLVFALLAVRTWRRRPREGRTPDLPLWLATVDRLNVGRAATLGLVLAVLNPKNLVIFPVAGSTIATADATTAQQAAAVALFTCVASSTVVLPVLAYAAAQSRVAGPLDRIRGLLIRNSAVIIVLLAGLIAAVLLARGITGLLHSGG